MMKSIKKQIHENYEKHWNKDSVFLYILNENLILTDKVMWELTAVLGNINGVNLIRLFENMKVVYKK